VERDTRKALASYKGAFYHPRDVKKVRQQAEESITEPEDPLTPYLLWLMDPTQWTGHKGASAFKTVAGIVSLVEEHGVVDDNGNLRIGADIRRLAEAAGTTDKTIRESALPHLMVNMKALKWRKGKGSKAGSFVLKKPPRETYSPKVATHFKAVSFAHPKNALETIRQLVRMRGGQSKNATLLRLGMPAMFVLVVMTQDPSCGYTLSELAVKTGRRKRDLDSPSNQKSVIKRLKAAGIIKEVSEERYRLTAEFGQRYQQHLEFSGIVYSEHRQRERHREHREARRKRQHEKPDKQPNKLKGKDHMRTVREQNRKREREAWIEEQRRKVGETAVTFLDEELRGVVAMGFSSLKRRWMERGGNMRDLWRAIQYGPFRKYRERDGSITITRDDEEPEDDGFLSEQQRIRRLVHEGMSERLARAEVLGEEVL
jgi:hypothetical protein